ncbi:hypothetical protein LEMLEM_LOCUS3406 [Lemmus lemmus]
MELEAIILNEEACTALAEEPSSVFSTQFGCLTTAYSSDFKGIQPLCTQEKPAFICV